MDREGHDGKNIGLEQAERQGLSHHTNFKPLQKVTFSYYFHNGCLKSSFHLLPFHKNIFFSPTAGLMELYRSHRELAGVKLQSLGLAQHSHNYRQPNMDV